MEIAIFGSYLNFSGDVYESTKLGGSECAVFYMKEELEKLGHSVTVIHDETTESVAHSFSKKWDVFIASRSPLILRQEPLKARLRVLWAHDLPTNASEIKMCQHYFDVGIVHSEFQRAVFEAACHETVGKYWVGRGGIDHRIPIRTKWAEKEGFLYASRPERGLEYLQMWGIPHTATTYTKGARSKKDFYEILSKAKLVLYPCTWPEIFCAVAVEAMAAGTPIITTDGWALRENVPMEYLVPGTPGYGAYERAFRARIDSVLSGPGWYEDQCERLSAMARKKYTWEGIAKDWVKLFEGRLK